MADPPAFDGVLYLIGHLCHDLVSPVGAINNGLELLEESGSPVDREAMALIAQSARMLTARLRCYRLAYGTAGRSLDCRPSDARAVLQDWFAADRRFILDWPVDPKRSLQPGFVQLLLNGVILIAQLSPRGGKISVLFDESAPQTTQSKIIGTKAEISRSTRAVLTGKSNVADYRAAQAWFCRQLLEYLSLDEAAAIEFIAQEQGAGLSLTMQVSLDDG